MTTFSRNPNAQRERERINALFMEYKGEVKQVASNVFGEQLTPLTKRETRGKNARKMIAHDVGVANKRKKV